MPIPIRFTLRPRWSKELVKELVKENDENKEAYSGASGPHNRRRRSIKIEPLT
jgi:hypothetical protein